MQLFCCIFSAGHSGGSLCILCSGSSRSHWMRTRGMRHPEAPFLLSFLRVHLLGQSNPRKNTRSKVEKMFKKQFSFFAQGSKLFLSSFQIAQDIKFKCFHNILNLTLIFQRLTYCTLGVFTTPLWSYHRRLWSVKFGETAETKLMIISCATLKLHPKTRPGHFPVRILLQKFPHQLTFRSNVCPHPFLVFLLLWKGIKLGHHKRRPSEIVHLPIEAQRLQLCTCKLFFLLGGGERRAVVTVQLVNAYM